MTLADTDFQWLIDHSAEIYARCGGKWIAVSEKRVVAVAETAPEAARLAREKVGAKRFVLEAIDQESDAIYAHIRVA